VLKSGRRFPAKNDAATKDYSIEWGSEAAAAAWLERQIHFIRFWEAERLSTRLF
jgi:hypothetical protein